MSLFQRLLKWLSRERTDFSLASNHSIKSFHNLDPEFYSDRWSRNEPRLLTSTTLESRSSPVGFPPSLPTKALLREPYPHIEEPKPTGPIYQVPRKTDELVIHNATPPLKEEELLETNRTLWLSICGCKYMLSHLCHAAH